MTIATIINTTLTRYPTFLLLFTGQWQKQYPSHSEADLAMIRMLKNCGASRNEAIEIFEKSKLADRDKWKKRVDYKEETIKKVYGEEKFSQQFNIVT